MDASDWDERYRTAELVWTAEPNRFVEQECRALPPGRALDVAAGEGRNSVWLAGLGWRVTAVDFSSVGLEKGRELAEQRAVGDRIEWVRADVRDWTPAAGAYDLVVVAYLHLPAGELAGVLARAAGALAAGGKVVVVGHDLANLEHGVGGPRDPSVLYRPDAVRAALAGAGLAGIRAATVERPTPAGTALDTLVTATREGGTIPMTYSYRATTGLSFEDAVARVKEAFKAQGFGVLTEIDIQATLREKVGVETEPYVILGACNPAFASRALALDPGVGVFLPCNVVVRRSGGDTVIEAMDPAVMEQFFDAPAMAELIGEVAPRVQQAVADAGA